MTTHCSLTSVQLGFKCLHEYTTFLCLVSPTYETRYLQCIDRSLLSVCYFYSELIEAMKTLPTCDSSMCWVETLYVRGQMKITCGHSDFHLSSQIICTCTSRVRRAWTICALSNINKMVRTCAVLVTIISSGNKFRPGFEFSYSSHPFLRALSTLQPWCSLIVCICTLFFFCCKYTWSQEGG